MTNAVLSDHRRFGGGQVPRPGDVVAFIRGVAASVLRGENPFDVVPAGPCVQWPAGDGDPVEGPEYVLWRLLGCR